MFRPINDRQIATPSATGASSNLIQGNVEIVSLWKWQDSVESGTSIFSRSLSADEPWRTE